LIGLIHGVLGVLNIDGGTVWWGDGQLVEGKGKQFVATHFFSLIQRMQKLMEEWSNGQMVQSVTRSQQMQNTKESN
jgi:hypothetical protein